MAEDWKVQVSYKTPAGDLINIRAVTADELSVLIENIGDYATQIAATGKLIQGAYQVAPLGTTGTTTSTDTFTASAPTQATTPFVTSAPQVGTPTCVHGARKFMSGVSKKTGNPYSMWVCQQAQGDNQCKPVNA